MAKEIIGNCPTCHYIIFKQGNFCTTDKGQFVYGTACPKCGHQLRISLGVSVKVEDLSVEPEGVWRDKK